MTKKVRIRCNRMIERRWLLKHHFIFFKRCLYVFFYGSPSLSLCVCYAAAFRFFTFCSHNNILSNAIIIGFCYARSHSLSSIRIFRKYAALWSLLLLLLVLLLVLLSLSTNSAHRSIKCIHNFPCSMSV